jgi:hypothetical protein
MNDDDIKTINITGYGAGQPSYTYNVGAGGLSGSSGTDTITIDSSLYSSGSLTSASTSTINWNQTILILSVPTLRLISAPTVLVCNQAPTLKLVAVV